MADQKTGFPRIAADQTGFPRRSETELRTLDQQQPELDPLVYELMRRATRPMVPQISQGWSMLADLLDNPRGGSSNVPLETLKGLIAGGMTGLGDAAAGMTSPLGIASGAVASALGPEMRAAAPGMRALLRRGPKPPSGGPAPPGPEFMPTDQTPPSRWATMADVGGGEAGAAAGSADTGSSMTLTELMRRLGEGDFGGSGTGKVNVDLLVKLAALGGGAAYGIPKLMQVIKGMQGAKQKYNPLDRYADVVKEP